MEVLFIVLGILAGFAFIMFGVSALAALLIMSGPPDAYDVDIQGTIKKDE